MRKFLSLPEEVRDMKKRRLKLIIEQAKQYEDGILTCREFNSVNAIEKENNPRKKKQKQTFSNKRFEGRRQTKEETFTVCVKLCYTKLDVLNNMSSCFIVLLCLANIGLDY